MSGAVVGALVLALLAGTGLLVGATLRTRSAAELLLTTYVVAFAVVVALSLFLSLFGALTRTALVLGSALALAVAAGSWFAAGRPRLTPRRVPLGLAALPVPLLALSIAVALGLSYVVVLILGTAPNGWDPLNYHLARAALWLQSGRIGYIDAAYDERLNFNPPNAEIALTYVFEVTRDETLAGFVQFFAAIASATGVFALARRIGLSRNEAAFGALIFLTLPIVVLQSSGSKNDLVVASFLTAASVFVLGGSRGELALASLATALAIGTKFTAAYGLVVLLALALFATPRDRRLGRVLALAIGGLVGSYWYVVNAVETGHVLGDQSNIAPLTAPFELRENLVTGYGLMVDTLDLSGAKGDDLLLYLASAILVAVGLVLLRRRSRGGWLTAPLAAAMVASPLALLVISNEVGRPSLLELYDLLDASKGYLAVEDDVSSSPTTASDTASWFGPAGFLLMIGAAVAAVVWVRRKSLPGLGRVLGLAPLIWLPLVAVSLTYHPWQGRFFVFPLALSCALWGLILRVRAAAWGAVALAATTMLLSLVHYVEKPSGLRLLDRSHSVSVWDLERWEIQSQHDPPLAPVLRYLDKDVPRSDSVALALGANSFGYPVFGPHFEREVHLVPFGSNARDVRSDWLLAIPQREPEVDATCWRAVLRSERGTIFRRANRC